MWQWWRELSRQDISKKPKRTENCDLACWAEWIGCNLRLGRKVVLVSVRKEQFQVLVSHPDGRRVSQPFPVTPCSPAWWMAPAFGFEVRSLKGSKERREQDDKFLTNSD